MADLEAAATAEAAAAAAAEAAAAAALRAVLVAAAAEALSRGTHLLALARTLALSRLLANAGDTSLLLVGGRHDVLRKVEVLTEVGDALLVEVPGGGRGGGREWAEWAEWVEWRGVGGGRVVDGWWVDGWMVVVGGAPLSPVEVLTVEGLGDEAARGERLHELHDLDVRHLNVIVLGLVEVLLGDEDALCHGGR